MSGTPGTTTAGGFRSRRGIRWIAATAATGVIIAGCASGGGPSTGGSGPRDAAKPFAAWTTPVPADAAPDPSGAAAVARLARGAAPVADLYAYGTPVFAADARTPRVGVTCLRPWGDCALQDGPVPIPAEATPAPGTDGALVVVEEATDTAFEFWQAQRQPDGSWHTSWGSRTRLAGDGREGETGSGTSLLAGLVRTDEIRAGRIDHALQLAAGSVCRGQVVAPAVKTDGKDAAPDCVPMGTRLQLDPALDVDRLPGLSPAARTVARAWQTYGGYVQNSAGTNLVVGFENPAGEDDPYPAAGLQDDYAALPLPLDRLREVAPP